jgi:hypothetical protein
VLYEMLAGRRAFTGEMAAARLTAILTADPPELQRQATSLPPAVAGIVHRCLAKTREDGREIYYRSNNRMIAIPVTTAPSLRVGEPGVLFEDAFVSGIIGARAYDVAPDGRFLMMQAIGNRDPREVRIVFDWFSELRARVP